jgi:hypothetical protein
MYTLFVGDKEMGELSYEQLSNAAKYVRKKYNIATEVTITGRFEREFNCKIVNHCDSDGSEFMDAIVFRNDQSLTMFLLMV